MGKNHKDLEILLTLKRKDAGITQAVLAEAVQVSRKSINAIENGIYIPSTVLSLKIATVAPVTTLLISLGRLKMWLMMTH